MDYYRVEEAMQAVIGATMPLSPAQKERIRQVCEAVLLARSSQMLWLARRLAQPTQKDSRIQYASSFRRQLKHQANKKQKPTKRG